MPLYGLWTSSMQSLNPVSEQGQDLRGLPTFQRGLRQEQELEQPEA